MTSKFQSLDLPRAIERLPTSEDAVVQHYNELPALQWDSTLNANAASFVPLSRAAKFGDDQLPEINAAEIEVVEEVYKGAMSTVYKGVWRGSPVAIKTFTMLPDNMGTEGKDKAESTLVAELRVLSKLHHPRVLMLMGVCRDFGPSGGGGRGRAIITEYMSRGSLYNALHSESVNTADSLARMPMAYRLRIILDIIEGLRFLHASRVVHCDFKSPNVLIDENRRAKIADFGVSKIRHTSMTHVTGVVGTRTPPNPLYLSSLLDESTYALFLFLYM